MRRKVDRRPRVKVMFDYGAFPPLWTGEPDPDFEHLLEGVDAAIIDQLNDWAGRMEALMWGDHGPESSYPDPEEVRRLDREGRDLARALKTEVGETWVVEFSSEATNAIEEIDLEPDA